MSLTTYNKKRNFKNTREPQGKKEAKSEFRFVIQRHMASHLHYDVRLELDGVLKSWAVPKGPSLNPSQKRLAVMTEDHPVKYLTFKGIIPEGNYGAGIMEIWDSGTFEPVSKDHEVITEKQALQHLKKGDFKFSLKGKKLKGEFVLVKLKGQEKNWLLIKHKDKYATEIVYDAEAHTGKAIKKTPAKKAVRKPAKQYAENNTELKIGKYKVPVTNRNKVYWPDEGFTKGEVLDYYDAMSEYILPHLKGRPLSLKRNPNGIRDDGFYHKDAGENAPAYADVFPVKAESNNKVIDYLVCNNKATLLYIANLGCIEMNPWNSTTSHPDKPTWMVIDIDPSHGNTFDEVVDVALATKMILDNANVKSYCKTSGSSGLHVYIPMNNKYSFKTVKDFAHIVASLVQEQLPKTTTLERSLAKRGNRIYIDFLQNRTGQTLASAYSLRPVPGASASAPLDWKEVNHKLSPAQFTIKNLLQRVKKKGDLFAPVLTGVTSIQDALNAFGSKV